MRVILPYTRLRDEVLEALLATGYSYTQVYVGVNDESYFDLLQQLWSEKQTFCLVEHDVVVRFGSLDELAHCPHDWCSFEIPIGPQIWPSLGCCKFSQALIERHPNMWQEIARWADKDHPPKHWCRIDRWTWRYLTERGEAQHVHRSNPPLGHLRDDQAVSGHGCEVAL